MAGKGFVWSPPERRPGQSRLIRTDIAVLFVGDEAEKQALLLGEPEVFFTAAGYDGLPLVLLRLVEVDDEHLTELVTDAWQMRAPTHSPKHATRRAQIRVLAVHEVQLRARRTPSTAYGSEEMEKIDHQVSRMAVVVRLLHDNQRNPRGGPRAVRTADLPGLHTLARHPGVGQPLR